MKDELDGLIIEEAYFIDIKKYGYYYFDKDNNRIVRSVIAGVERDSGSFEEIKNNFQGGNLLKKSHYVFIRASKIWILKYPVL